MANTSATQIDSPDKESQPTLEIRGHALLEKISEVKKRRNRGKTFRAVSKSTGIPYEYVRTLYYTPDFGHEMRELIGKEGLILEMANVIEEYPVALWPALAKTYGSRSRVPKWLRYARIPSIMKKRESETLRDRFERRLFKWPAELNDDGTPITKA